MKVQMKNDQLIYTQALILNEHVLFKGLNPTSREPTFGTLTRELREWTDSSALW